MHKENQDWKENKKSKTVPTTRCINLTVNQVAVLQYETQTMCIIIHDDVYQGVYKNISLFYNTFFFSNICRIQCDNPENIMQLLSLSPSIKNSIQEAVTDSHQSVHIYKYQNYACFYPGIRVFMNILYANQRCLGLWSYNNRSWR